MSEITLVSILSLPHADREQAFVDILVDQRRDALVTQIDALLPQLPPEQQSILYRWKSAVLLRSPEQMRTEDWAFILRDHLFESLCTQQSIEEALLTYLYERAITNTDLQEDSAIVEREHAELRKLLEQATTPIAGSTKSIMDMVRRLTIASKDSLAFTETLTEVRQLLTRVARATGVPEEDISAVAGIAIDHFLACANLLLYIETKDIYMVVLHTMDPELFEAPEGGFSRYEYQEARRTLPLYDQIRMEIITLFGDPELLDIKDIGMVMNFLQDVAVGAEDEKIKELVVFDEASGTFVFNDTMVFQTLQDEDIKDTKIQNET